jgi:hypothetical protein
VIYLVIILFSLAGVAGLITGHDVSGAVFLNGSVIVLVLQKILDKLTGPEEK